MIDENSTSFDISSLFPEFIVDSRGTRIEFDINNIKRDLSLQTGMDDETAQMIIDQVVKNIISDGKKEITSSRLKELIFVELSLRGMDKYTNIFTYGMQFFSLDDSFVKKYTGKEPNWGPLGYIAYKRTYSRLKSDGTIEEFWETIKRVVEGCFTIQKTHCQTLGLPWNEDKAQKSAQLMYDKIWTFKFLPPGRGLWIMGTDHVYKHGSMSLNNCGFISTKNLDLIKSKPFEFMMDASMLGVGVGFDTKGADSLIVKKPLDGTYIFKIPDTREGWVEGLRLLLLAFFEGQQIPTYDYSLVRPKGSIIHGFGGIASGPDPLISMFHSITELLSSRIGLFIRSIDIVDFMNYIAKCVVSGNVRRSAQIALGTSDDMEYITMKDPVLHEKEVKDHRWASNNSIIVDPDAGFDYTDVSKSISKNGEPGIIWLENARKYSRLCDPPDWKDKNVCGVNPCFSGDTLIAVADGRGAVSIRELADEGLDVPVYSLDPNGIVEIKMGRNPRITGYDKELLRITFEDGTSIKVTPDHEMILLNGTRVNANDLRVGDSLPRFIRETATMGTRKYLRVWRNTIENKKNREVEHRIIARFNDEKRWNELYDEGIKNGYAETSGIVVHHRDGNTLNNSPDNLEIKSFTDHYADHGFFDVEGEKNPMHGREHSNDTKALIGKRTMERCQDDDYRKKLALAIKNGMDDDDVRQKISESRHRANVEFYKKFEQETDLETIWIGDQLFVKKKCEACGTDMMLAVRDREQCYCSRSCGNKKKEGVENRKEGQRTYFNDKQRDTLHQQVIMFKDLKSRLGKDPMKSEWELECKTRGIPFRLNNRSENPHALKNYAELKERASSYNHRVASIERLEMKENVYNITVDDNHTICVILSHDPVTLVSNGIFTAQCGEQSLETYELCCLVETFPSNHDSYEEFKETLKSAYLYAKSVTLMRTHWKETNAVMLKNRRIGTSVSGIIDAFAKFGRREFINWLQKGYNYLKEVDEIYSNWLCIPKSVKITTVKPSGTVSLLAGVSPGIHYPHSEYYIRRIRINSDSELLPIFRDAGCPIEPDAYSDDNTMVVSFPVKTDNFTMGKNDVSMEMQAMNAIDIQKYWSDNQVSITVTFNKEESKRLKHVLQFCEDKLKGISLFPSSEHGYVQAPYEEITKETYEKMMSAIDFKGKFKGWSTKKAGSGVTDCDGDRCTTL